MRYRRPPLTVTVVLIIVFMLASAVTLTAKMRNINTKKAYEFIEERDGEPDFVILDVRTPKEFAQGHIENAANMDFYEEAFPDELENLDKSKTYLVYCRSGSRSGSTFKMMKKMGFQDVYNMEGGIEGWRANYPVVE